MGIVHEPHHDGSPLYVSDSTPRLGDHVRVRVRALSESQQLLIAAARDHDRAAAQGALRMLGLITVPTAALEAEADEAF